MTSLFIRDAQKADLPFIVGLIDDDAIASARDPAQTTDSADQLEAFRAINKDANHRLLVAELDGVPIGSFQLSFIPGVSRRGAWRGQIEAVRIHQNYRGRSFGSEMMDWAIAEAKERGCGLVQLTSDIQRETAHCFYEKLGFVASHSGFKLKLR